MTDELVKDNGKMCIPVQVFASCSAKKQIYNICTKNKNILNYTEYSAHKIRFRNKIIEI